MTKEERAALDPDKKLHMNPSWQTAFPKGGEPLLDWPTDMARLQRFLPKDAGESDADYIQRCVDRGCLLTVSSAEVTQNPRILRDRMTESIEQNVPLMKITMPVPDHRIRVPTESTREADERRKADVLDQLRNPNRARQDAETARQIAVEARLREEHNQRIAGILGLTEAQLQERRSEFPTQESFDAALATLRANAA